MSSLATSWVVFGVIFGGALLGLALRRLLPDHHLESETKDVVKLGMGLVGAMAALVLGLLTASAKSSFDAQRNEVAQLAANVALLDRGLAHYGPDAAPVREELRTTVAGMIDQLWPGPHDRSAAEPTVGSEQLYDRLQSLSPKTDGQRTIQATAIKIATDVGQTRKLLAAQKSSSMQPPFLVVMTFWFAALFASFSLFARPNATAVMALAVAALSIAGAIFLILEMDQPFDGMIRLSSDPLRRALEQLGR